jgi:N-acetyltransferase
VINLQPVLTGNTLLLRPLAAGDWAELYRVASDPEVWAVHPAHDRWQEPVFRQYFDDALASGGALAICRRDNGAIIGASRYDLSRVEPGEVEIGWTFLARAYWGGTTNHELKSLMVNHALAGFAACVFLVGEHNVRSRRAMQKIGGKLLDRCFEAPMAGGALVRHVIYRIDRPLLQKTRGGGCPDSQLSP